MIKMGKDGQVATSPRSNPMSSASHTFGAGPHDAHKAERDRALMPPPPRPVAASSSSSNSNSSDQATGYVDGGASLTSSIRAHVFEHGLRYHAYHDGQYPFPNDEHEQSREDMKHTLTMMLCEGRHFYAPVVDRLRNGGQCLDLGTGTGIWSIEVGEAFPECKVTGLDLSPIQPDLVPENVEFFVDDFEEDWVDEDNKFDFIHMRHTLLSVRDRKALLRRAYRHLKPGGYVEFQEFLFEVGCDDGTVTPDMPYAFRDYVIHMESGLAALGSELNGIGHIPNEMAAAGFDDIHDITHQCPLGGWAEDERTRVCGIFLQAAALDGLRGLSQRPLGNGLRWKNVQIEMFLVNVRKAISDPRLHVWLPFHIVYGRKPEK